MTDGIIWFNCQSINETRRVCLPRVRLIFDNYFRTIVLYLCKKLFDLAFFLSPKNSTPMIDEMNQDAVFLDLVRCHLSVKFFGGIERAIPRITKPHKRNENSNNNNYTTHWYCIFWYLEGETFSNDDDDHVFLFFSTCYASLLSVGNKLTWSCLFF